MRYIGDHFDTFPYYEIFDFDIIIHLILFCKRLLSLLFLQKYNYKYL